MSERYHNQYRSKTVKAGEPPTHSLACRIVKAWYRGYVPGCIIEKDWPVYFSREFMTKEKLDYPYHEYDLAFFEYVDGNKGESHAELHTVIEVDGERHYSKLVKINDNLAEKWIRERYPKAKFVRLIKSDCLHENIEERSEYFKKKLLELATDDS